MAKLKGAISFITDDGKTDHALKWAELGRSVGELRNGDIVRFLEFTGTPDYEEGSLAVIRNVEGACFVFGNGKNYIGVANWVELVAPAESVVNLRIKDVADVVS